MSKNRYIDTRFWSDTWVMDSLTKMQRLLFLYLLTNDKTSIAGVYEISLKTIMIETDFTKEELVQLLEGLKSRVLYKEGWIILRKAIKHQAFHNPKIEMGIINALSKAPKELLEFVEVPKDAITIKKYVESNMTPDNKLDLDTLSIGDGELSHHNSNSNSNLNSNRNLKPGKPAGSEGYKIHNKELATSYAKAVKADEALAKKENEASNREPDGKGLQAAREIAERIKLKAKAVLT